MPKNKIIITLGVLIVLIPVFGFPHLWEAIFQVIAGLLIVLLSVWTNIDRRISLKAKAQRRQMHKRLTAEIGAEREALKQEQVLEGGEQ